MGPSPTPASATVPLRGAQMCVLGPKETGVTSGAHPPGRNEPCNPIGPVAASCHVVSQPWFCWPCDPDKALGRLSVLFRRMGP